MNDRIDVPVKDWNGLMVSTGVLLLTNLITGSVLTINLLFPKTIIKETTHVVPVTIVRVREKEKIVYKQVQIPDLDPDVVDRVAYIKGRITRWLHQAYKDGSEDDKKLNESYNELMKYPLKIRLNATIRNQELCDEWGK